MASRRRDLPANFASNCGLSSLYEKGATGAGQTLAIVTLAARDPGAPQWPPFSPNPGRAVPGVPGFLYGTVFSLTVN